MTVLVRRLYPGFKSSVPFVHCGAWDRPGVFVAAMALTLLGVLPEPSNVRDQATGPAAQFWDKAWPHVLLGLTASELAALFWEVRLGVQPQQLVVDHLGMLTSKALVRNQAFVLTDGRERAVLVAGVEGAQQGHRFEAEALLLVDPTKPTVSLESVPLAECENQFDGAVVVGRSPTNRR